MALPLSGPISFGDLNEELGNTPTQTQLDMITAGTDFGFSAGPAGNWEDSNAGLSLSEFYGATGGGGFTNFLPFTLNSPANFELGFISNPSPYGTAWSLDMPLSQDNNNSPFGGNTMLPAGPHTITIDTEADGTYYVYANTPAAGLFSVSPTAEGSAGPAQFTINVSALPALWDEFSDLPTPVQLSANATSMNRGSVNSVQDFATPTEPSPGIAFDSISVRSQYNDKALTYTPILVPASTTGTYTVGTIKWRFSVLPNVFLVNSSNPIGTLPTPSVGSTDSWVTIANGSPLPPSNIAPALANYDERNVNATINTANTTYSPRKTKIWAALATFSPLSNTPVWYEMNYQNNTPFIPPTPSGPSYYTYYAMEIEQAGLTPTPPPPTVAPPPPTAPPPTAPPTPPPAPPSFGFGGFYAPGNAGETNTTTPDIVLPYTTPLSTSKTIQTFPATLPWTISLPSNPGSIFGTSPNSGIGGPTPVTISVSPNLTTSQRTGTVRASSPIGNVQYNIIQEANPQPANPEILVTGTGGSTATGGGSVTFNFPATIPVVPQPLGIDTNVPFSIGSISNPQFSFSPSSGTRPSLPGNPSPTSVTVSSTNPSTFEATTATAVVSSPAGPVTINLFTPQNNSKSYLAYGPSYGPDLVQSPTPYQFEVTGTAGAKSFQVTTNSTLPFTVTTSQFTPPSPLYAPNPIGTSPIPAPYTVVSTSPSPLGQLTTYLVSMNLPANPSPVPRVGSVYISSPLHPIGFPAQNSPYFRYVVQGGGTPPTPPPTPPPPTAAPPTAPPPTAPPPTAAPTPPPTPPPTAPPAFTLDGTNPVGFSYTGGTTRTFNVGMVPGGAYERTITGPQSPFFTMSPGPSNGPVVGFAPGQFSVSAPFFNPSAGVTRTATLILTGPSTIFRTLTQGTAPPPTPPPPTAPPPTAAPTPPPPTAPPPTAPPPTAPPPTAPPPTAPPPTAPPPTAPPPTAPPITPAPPTPAPGACTQFFTQATGDSSSCISLDFGTRRRFFGNGPNPEIGDRIYTNISCTSVLVGLNRWYNVLGDFSSIKVDFSGNVVDKRFC